MYRFLFSAVFGRMSPETAHRVAFRLIRAAAAVPGGEWLFRRFLAPRDPVLRVRALGFELPSPFGLAAGFDKDAEGPDALAALGFGFIEVGTVTAHAQPGNPKPRLFRLAADQALINRMGFNNKGAAAAANRLRARSDNGVVVGANIGKTKIVPESEAIADYVHSAKLLADVADYLVINVSSPNTPGLRNLQKVSTLRPLLQEVRAAVDSATSRRLPMLVKIAPDLSDEDIDAIADLAIELNVDGIIATNTPVSRENLKSRLDEIEAAGVGGLSGAPIRGQAMRVLQRLHARVGDRIVLIASGGITTPADAWERICAGATLVQAYTGFIYGGPLWPSRMNAALAGYARSAGFASVQEASGSAYRLDDLSDLCLFA
jgi:dihydroorotate dehydrogenase